MSILIRRPLPGEEDLMAAVHVQGWREAYAGLLPAEYLANLDATVRAKLWRANLAKPDMIVLAAFDGDQLVGFAYAGPMREIGPEFADGELLAIYILRSHSRLGIGKSFMAHIAQEWRARGGKRLALTVIEGNAPAMRFYERLGGREAGKRSFALAGLELTEAIYVFDDLIALANRQ